MTMKCSTCGSKAARKIQQGLAADPDLVLSSDTPMFLAVAAGRLEPAEAVASEAIRVEGDQDVRTKCIKMLRRHATTG